MSDYHRFNVTVSDPQHTYVSKRKEKISKTIRVPKKHPVEKAQQIAAKHYKNLGFNVHSIEHIKEELVTELSKELKDRYLRRAIPDHGMANLARRQTKEGTKAHQYWKKKEQDRKKGISRAMKEEQLIDSLIVEGSDYHRFNVTVSDPQHTAVSKRKEKISKTIRVPKKHPVEKAQQIAAKHYKNLGFNVHSIEHIKEELVFDEGEIELCFEDINAVEDFIIEALKNDVDDNQIIEAIEQYFGQLDEKRRMGYIKSLKVSNHHNRGGFAAPAAMSAAAGAAGGGLATGHKAGAIAGAALGVGTVAAAHLNQVRKDAKMIRGTGHGHKVYSDDFAKAAEDRYDRYKKKPLHKRIATRIRAMNGKGDHIYDSYDPAIAMAAKFISHQNRPETLFHRPVNESVKKKNRSN